MTAKQKYLLGLLMKAKRKHTHSLQEEKDSPQVQAARALVEKFDECKRKGMNDRIQEIDAGYAAVRRHIILGPSANVEELLEKYERCTYI